MITISRNDAINAEGACLAAAHKSRTEAKSRRNGGSSDGDRAHRQWLRDCADEYEATAKILRTELDR